MLVLFESPAGYAIFKVLKEKKLKKAENLYEEFETPEKASKLLQLKHFEKFEDMKDALKVATAIVEGKLNKKLKKLLKKAVLDEVQEELAVADAKLGNAITSKLNIQCVTNSSIQELMRCIRGHMDSLIGLPEKEVTAMSLGLAHSLSRYKLKFSPDKVDIMIVQAIGLLDDLDKELNNYTMRCREWYGWHFPELSKIVTDIDVFAKVVIAVGLRNNALTCDLSDVVPEDVAKEIKYYSQISVGTQISETDMMSIQALCKEIILIHEYRSQLYEYLKNRMLAVAPNLTVLVGELVGARLIAHAGSLLNLAKHPASTIQILGAEKALFRALKSKQDTPKYGLIYHAQLVGQSNSHIKGKVSRMLAAKAALACRVDALGDDAEVSDIGVEHRANVERRMKMLEEGKLYRISGTAKAAARREKYDNKSEVLQYKDEADAFLKSESTEKVPKKRKFEQDEAETPTPVKKKKKKLEKEIKQEPEGE